MSAPAAGDLVEASASAPRAPQLPGPGGPWVGCYAHFRPTSTPLRDVTRLGLLCGSAGGLRPIAPAYQGTLAQGGEHSFPFSLERGQCVRAFAVSGRELTDLDLAIYDPTGILVRSDGIDDRWPVLPPDGMLCVALGGTYELRVSARKGAGDFAAQLWLLP
ncbi:MAG: hypothetical protein NZX77_11930 [Polyangiaceae bacterium]|nr:hypothetical protein [Polyangiaceae bacterium]